MYHEAVRHHNRRCRRRTRDATRDPPRNPVAISEGGPLHWLDIEPFGITLEDCPCALSRSFVIGAASPGPAAAGQAADDATFTRDVLPVLQQSCQQCHRPGTGAPMSLLTYEETRPWARAIRDRVVARQMPPWHIDRSIGEYVADPSLSDDEIATIVNWVAAGAPRGRARAARVREPERVDIRRARSDRANGRGLQDSG